jgi:hypothetical protein
MAEEHLLLVLAIEQRTELVGHAELGHHRAGQLGRHLDVAEAPEVTFS